MSKRGRRWTLEVLEEKDKLFKDFPRVQYATNMSFRQSQKPIGAVIEAHPCYFRKHKFHSFKI